MSITSSPHTPLLGQSVSVPTAKQVRFTPRQLLSQAKADLWAKEVQSGYTTTYAWMANQLGHFALGFIPIYVLIWVAEASGIVFWNWTQFVIPTLWLGWFIFKEMGDINEAIRDARDANVFPMDASDVRKDAYTAIYFFSAGLAVACADLAAPWHNDHRWYWLPVGVFALQFLIGFFPAYYWLSRKKCFQQADLPYIFRLAYFPKKIASPDGAAAEIIDFTSLKAGWRHLLICGRPESGKTSLASAIGTEHTFCLGRVRYLAALEFLQFADLDHDPLASETRPLWPWKDSNILILDDLDPSLDHEKILNRQEIVRRLSELKGLNDLRKLQTVWVIGNEQNLDFWRQELSSLLAVQISAMGVIRLTAEQLQPAKTAAAGFA